MSWRSRAGSSWRSRAGSVPRRTLLAACLALAACGFEPVLEEGAAPGIGVLIDPDAPVSELDFFYRARLVERIGPAEGAPLTLSYEIATDTVRQAITPDRVTERFLINGLVRWTLSDPTGEVARGDAIADSSFSSTGSTVATAAAERDAQRRLMTALADRTLTAVLAKLP